MGKDLSPEIVAKIKQLEEKYAATGQNLSSYLDGLLHADYLTYWDYIHLDTLLSLQTPKTEFPDERIFIMYHQITELYFKMILWEIDQLTGTEPIGEDYFLDKIRRINRCFDQVTESFDIMVDGLRKEEFQAFRMALLPSSGFQSVQYRLIELSSTDLINLASYDSRFDLGPQPSPEVLYQHIYWKKGATELATGKQTLTLVQFENKYHELLMQRASDFAKKNIWQRFLGLPAENRHCEIIDELRRYDRLANIDWPLAHFRSAAQHLQKDPGDIAATGGTNWQKYLPPRFQKVIFFPELWEKEERETWGKSWVKKEVFDQ